MAHHVVVEKLFRRTKDGRILTGKYYYRVKCKRCGDLHKDVKITSEGVAELCKANHHIDVRNTHQAKYPGDKAHIRASEKKFKKAGSAVKRNG